MWEIWIEILKWFHQQFLLHCSASGFEFENILLILKVMFLALTDHQSTLTVKIPSKLYKLYKQGLIQADLREVLNSKIFSKKYFKKRCWHICIFKTFAEGVFIRQVDFFWSCLFQLLWYVPSSFCGGTISQTYA